MNLKLKEVAFYASDRIQLSEVNLATYVTTDNLLQNKEGITRALSLPPSGGSVLEYEEGDILIGNIRPYLKKIWYATNNGGSSSDVLVIRVKKGYVPRFIYYSLFRDDFFHYVMKGSKGTKMPRGDKNHIMDFPIPDFDFKSQERIASILTTIDSKIELNNKINLELEAMAKLIYDYWFVQFDFPDENGRPYKSSGGKMVYNEELKREIPEGWSSGSLDSWIQKNKSGDWGKESEEGNYIQRVNCVRGADINGLNGNEEVNAPTRYILEKNNHKILEPHDLIVEISGGSPTQSTGRLAFITEETLERFENPVICSNFCKAVTLKNEKYLYNFAYQWNLLNENDVLFSWEGKTSGIKNLLFESFTSNMVVPMPPEDLAEKFYNFMHPLQAKKQKNLVENQELAKLRDWLLPMLMNGQVTVREAAKIVKSVPKEEIIN